MPLALRSLPPEVGLCTSSIPGAGCGICAKRKIPVGAWIGPYEGNFVKPEELSPTTDTSYMWEVILHNYFNHSVILLRNLSYSPGNAFLLLNMGKIQFSVENKQSDKYLCAVTNIIE